MTRLDTTFSALADPTRRAILARLALGEATVTELAAPFDMSQPAISRHLKVLEGAGLIIRRVERTTRPCRLAPGAIAVVEESAVAGFAAPEHFTTISRRIYGDTEVVVLRFERDSAG